MYGSFMSIITLFIEIFIVTFIIEVLNLTIVTVYCASATFYNSDQRLVVISDRYTIVEPAVIT